MTNTSGAVREGLRSGLRRRHMTMIAIGGAVGAGLFVGSGSVIRTAGPAAVLSYAVAGVMVLCVLRALGGDGGRGLVRRRAPGGRIDRRVRANVVGALRRIHRRVAVLVSVRRAGRGRGRGRCGDPSAALLMTMTAVNLISVRSFGEFEFWFASIKVAAIVVFLILGVSYVLGLLPHGHGGFGNLSAHGGPMPHGISGVFSAIVVVMFAFGGTEIVTLAAAENTEPARAVARATSNVLWRVGVVVTIQPWDDAKVLTSPFVSALGRIGVPAAGTIMEVVILTAVLSVLNSAICVSSRMLYVLPRDGDAPTGLVKLTRRGVPARAVLLGTVAAWCAVLASAVSPDRVFSFLVNSIGVILAFCYLAIMFSHWRFRARMQRENPAALTYRLWGYPYVNWLVIAVLLVVMGSMLTKPDLRPQLLASIVSLAVVAAIYPLRVRFGRTPPASAAADIES